MIKHKKLKVGDKIKCIEDTQFFKCSNIYTIKEVVHKYNGYGFITEEFKLSHLFWCHAHEGEYYKFEMVLSLEEVITSNIKKLKKLL